MSWISRFYIHMMRKHFPEKVIEWIIARFVIQRCRFSFSCSEPLPESAPFARRTPFIQHIVNIICQEGFTSNLLAGSRRTVTYPLIPTSSITVFFAQLASNVRLWQAHITHTFPWRFWAVLISCSSSEHHNNHFNCSFIKYINWTGYNPLFYNPTTQNSPPTPPNAICSTTV